MTSCAGLSWGRGKTEGMEPGTEVGKPGGRFWCRAGCPRPGETGHSGQAFLGKEQRPQTGQDPSQSQASHARIRASPPQASPLTKPRQNFCPARASWLTLSPLPPPALEH